MVPDAELQLSVVIKALETAVLPAVDPANRLAMEQCQLAIATLGFVRLRLPLTRRMVRTELGGNLALADSLRASTETAELTSIINSTRAALADPDIDTPDLATANSALLATITAIVEASDGDPDLSRTVIAAVKAQSVRARAWYLPAGFEPQPELIPPLESLLGN